MHVVEILLPLADNDGRSLPPELWQWVRETLVERFGGLTAFTRSPAEGLWEKGEETQRDRIVVFEVMTERLDRDWWRDYRQQLEARFDQEEVVVRATSLEKL